MSTTNNLTGVFNLKWDLSHLGDDEFDAQLVKFPGYENIVRLASPKSYSFPEKIVFESNFNTLKAIDFPYNDVHWPIMSKKMLDILLAVRNFSHKAIPIVMVDDTVSLANRYDESGVAKPGIEDYRFVAVQLLERLDLFDWEHSIFKHDEDFPQRVFSIKKLVLKEPPDGFPPLFRLSADPIPLFVSSNAREALEKANIQGLEFVDLENFRA